MPDPDVIVPNLHWRYSGVTATSRMVTPVIAQRLRLAWLGSDAPHGVERLTLRGLWRLRRRARPVVWHARRNDEMLAGLVLKGLGWPLKLLFTSAAQRRHTAFTRRLIGRMDAVIATSEAAAGYLDVAPTVILHGVDTGRYRPPEDRASAFAETGLPGRYAIGCFGRVRAQKGADVFVEAMCRLLPRYPDFSAVVVGQVTPDQAVFNERLKKRVQEAGVADKIKFTGELPIDEVVAWYRRILIYAFTSRTEGFGLTLLEAMASGNALVATRAGAAEVVVDHGKTGILIPPGDADALVAALEPLMHDPGAAEAMGQRARQRVIADFSIEAEAARIAEVYEALLASAASTAASTVSGEMSSTRR